MIEALTKVFTAFSNVAAAYVFGSRVYGKAAKASDYDVAVLFRGDHTLDELLDITLRLADVLDVDLNSIDIVGLNDAPVEVAYDVIAKGKLIYCIDNELRVAFEAKLMREYMDLKPYLDLYYSLMFGRLLKLVPARS